MNNFEFKKNKNHIQIRSTPGLTPVTPEWNFNLWMYMLEDKNYCKELAEFLKSKEQEILDSTSPINDGGTGLGNNTVTSRYSTFNLFHINDYKINRFKELIETQFILFCQQLNIDISEQFYINCWYNVMKPGQKIHTHSHNLTRSSFFSGHFTVDCEDSYTYYICPVTKDKLEFTNNIGEGIFFPSYIEHGTSLHNGTRERVTIAFDIYYSISHVNHNIINNVVQLFGKDNVN